MVDVSCSGGEGRLTDCARRSRRDGSTWVADGDGGAAAASVAGGFKNWQEAPDYLWHRQDVGVVCSHAGESWKAMEPPLRTSE